MIKFWMISLQYYKKHKNSLLNSLLKAFGNWVLDYIPPKPKGVDEPLESFKNLIKKTVQQERHLTSIERV